MAAISDFNQALRLNPQEAEAYLKRGLVRHEMAQYSKDFNRDYMAAISDFNQALRLNPQEAEAYLKRGLVRYEMARYSEDFNRDYSGAVEDLQKAAKLFFEQEDIDNYQKAVSNICILLQNNCDSFLANPKMKNSF